MAMSMFWYENGNYNNNYDNDIVKMIKKVWKGKQIIRRKHK